MSDSSSVTSSGPWRVTIGGIPGGRVIRLHIGNATVILPALEAHKLGSALHAASGLDVADAPPLRVVCADCEGRGCGTCDGHGWRINPAYFSDEPTPGSASDA